MFDKVKAMMAIRLDQVLLNTNFSRKFMAKAIKKALGEKLGIQPDINVDCLAIRHEDGEKVGFNINISGSIEEAELESLLERVKIGK